MLGQPIVGEHVVDAEVARVVGHVIDARMAEVRQHVGEIEARHRDLADAHFQERAKRRVDPLLALGVAAGAGWLLLGARQSAVRTPRRARTSKQKRMKEADYGSRDS